MTSPIATALAVLAFTAASALLSHAQIQRAHEIAHATAAYAATRTEHVARLRVMTDTCQRGETSACDSVAEGKAALRCAARAIEGEPCVS